MIAEVFVPVAVFEMVKGILYHTFERLKEILHLG